MLWHYTRGSKKPSVSHAAELEKLTDGEVPANGWQDEASTVDSADGDAA